MQHQYKKGNIPLPEMRLRFVTEFEHYLLPIHHTVKKGTSLSSRNYSFLLLDLILCST